ncbi:MAG: di-heme oxidoredictase family protein [Pseudomonadota bacterium]
MSIYHFPRAPLLLLLLVSAPTASATDSDGDTIPDGLDNCVLAANPTQLDADADAIGTACDTDLNNDCGVNRDDFLLFRDAFQSDTPEADFDGNGIVNVADLRILQSYVGQAPGPTALISPCAVIEALPATATASSEFQPASFAVDDDPATRWESVHGIEPVTLTLDLGRSYPLDRLEVHWEAANAETYRIDGSNDGAGWTLLASLSGGQFGDRTDLIDVEGGWRYVRLTGERRSPGNVYGFSIWEFDVFGDANGAFDAIVDRDGDGVIDSQDECPDTPPGDEVDALGCTFPPRQEVGERNGWLAGGPDSARPDFTLYVYDRDLGEMGGQCNRACADAWPPLLVDDGRASGVPRLSRVQREDGTWQAAYQDRPLYFFANDATPDDALGDGLQGLWSRVPFDPSPVPLFDENTPLEPELQERTATELITRLADRARDRHAREDEFQAYDHYLSFYWEDRTVEIEIIDTVAEGGDTITFNVTSQWQLDPVTAELRFFYRGITTVAEYYDNGVMTPIDTTHYTRSISYNPKMGRPLQVGDRMEFELSQFLFAPPNGRSNYYGTAFLYIVGEGIVPWEARGVFGDGNTEREDSYPIASTGLTGGGTTLTYMYSGEPRRHYQQMPTNLAPLNGQVFVRGRRVHHTDFGDGSHDESPDNPVFSALSGLLGNHYINRSCVSCHALNGRALPPSPGHALDQYVVHVGDAAGNPDPAYGAVLQPQSVLGVSEGNAVLSAWIEADGLRTPVYAFTPSTPEAYSARIAPALIGAGLLEAITEADIEALADPDDADGDDISGRLQVVIDPQTDDFRIGRFGWKAGQAKVLHQVAAALNTDLGVMTSVRPFPDCGSEQDDCGTGGAELADEHLEDLSAYVALLGIRARRDLDDPTVLEGEQLFDTIGCTGCHVATFQTSPFHPHAELRAQTIHPYTDLLLHDMGAGLASSLGEGEASGAEWRTAPLWGIGLTGDVSGAEAYLHDGRARSLDEAIRWHGGEGASSRDAYLALDEDQRQALIAFLGSL